MVLVVAGTASSWAQSFEDIRLEREARLAVFQNVKAYSSNASIGNAYEADDFLNLFSDTVANHVVDFPMFNNVEEAELVPIKKYMRMYRSLFKERTRGMSLHLNHMKYQRSGPHLEIRAFVTKTFKGTTPENEWRFEDPLFERNLEIVWRCTDYLDLLNHWENPMDSIGRKKRKPKLDFRIQEVRWHASQGQNHVMLVKEAGLEAVTCGEPEIVRGDFQGGAIYVSESPRWVIRDSTGANSDTEILAPYFSASDSPSTILEARSFQTNADKRPWSWSLSTGASGAALKWVDSDHAENIEARSPFGSSVMASIGWAIEQTHKRVIDLWLGAGASMQRHHLKAQNVYFEEPEIDPDNFTYLRQTNGTQWTESLSETMGTVSLGVRYLERFKLSEDGSMTYFGVSAGISHSVKTSTSFDNSSSVIRQGYYEGLYGITIDENGIYDFGSYSASGAEANTSWSSASAVPIHGICARKRDPLTPWMTWIEVGPSLHFRTGTPSEEGPFISNSQLHSAFHEANRYTFVNLDVQVGIRKRIGWNTIEPCPPQP